MVGDEVTPRAHVREPFPRQLARRELRRRQQRALHVEVEVAPQQPATIDAATQSSIAAGTAATIDAIAADAAALMSGSRPGFSEGVAWMRPSRYSPVAAPPKPSSAEVGRSQVSS